MLHNMKMKKLTLVAMLLVISVCLYAQDDRPSFEDYLKAKKDAFGRYQQQKEDDFNAFRRQANAQFTAKMAEAWKHFGMEPPMEPPMDPDPITPVTRDKEPPLPPLPVKPGGTLAPVKTEPESPRPNPVPSLPKPSDSNESWFTFNFYNTPCKVRLDNSLKFKLTSIDERAVATIWQQLSGEASNKLVADCFRLVEEMNLCDWAAITLYQALGDAWLGKDSNEAVLFQMYLLTQTGFKARIGRTEHNLVVLIPFDGPVYGMSFYNRNGEEFYNVTGKKSESGCYIYQEAFPQERIASLRPTLPIFAENWVSSRTFSAKKYPEMSVQMKLNRNLLDFMDGYPQCRHDNFVYAGLSESTKQAIYPTLRKAIEGKPVDVAANMLLNFMHTAFDYETDIQQFGYEKPYFGDESFWYPFNDCEDRAVLYGIFVRDLLGIDVVLLEYPNHLSAAIALPEVRGSYLTVSGKRFLLCDPTYIGSSIGEVAEKYRNVSPTVIIVQ